MSFPGCCPAALQSPHSKPQAAICPGPAPLKRSVGVEWHLLVVNSLAAHQRPELARRCGGDGYQVSPQGPGPQEGALDTESLVSSPVALSKLIHGRSFACAQPFPRSSDLQSEVWVFLSSPLPISALLPGSRQLRVAPLDLKWAFGSVSPERKGLTVLLIIFILTTCQSDIFG